MEDSFEIWWMTLDKNLHTSRNKGSKQEARLEWGKLKPDEKLIEKIMWYTREKIRQDRGIVKRGGKICYWKHAVRLLRYKFWEDGLMDSAEISEVVNVDKCACGQAAQIGKECFSCYDDRTGEKGRRDALLKDHLINLDLWKKPDESRQDWNARCKAFVTSRGMGSILRN